MRAYTFTYTAGRAVKGLTVTAKDEQEATRKGLLVATKRNGDTPTGYTVRLRRV